MCINLMTIRGRKGFNVQWHGKTVGPQLHSSLEEACKALRKKQGLPRNAPLRLKTKFRKPAERRPKGDDFGGIYQHTSTGKWYAQKKFKLKKGFDNFQEVKKAVQKCIKKHPSKKMKRVVSHAKVKTSQLLHRVQCLVKWSEPKVKRKKMKRRWWFPPDMVASQIHAKRSKGMYKAEPALHCTSLGLKFGPWKDELLRQWGKEKVKLLWSKLSLKSRVQRLKRVLCATARGMGKKPVLRAWPRNANRFRDREMGPRPMYTGLGYNNSIAVAACATLLLHVLPYSIQYECTTRLQISADV